MVLMRCSWVAPLASTARFDEPARFGDFAFDMSLWPSVREVAWSRLPGCHGQVRDIAGALETLRFEKDVESDSFSDAWRDVLFGHAFHQGTIFPVTAHVLPFVFDIVDHSPALAKRASQERTEIAMFVACCASSALRAASSPQSPDHASGREVLATLGAHADRLRAWTRSDLRAVAIATMLNVPELASGVLGGEEYEVEDVLSAILVHARWLSPSVLAWAGEALARLSTHPVAAAASRLLIGAETRTNSVDDARFRALAEALASAGTLEQRFDPLRDVFGIVTSPRAAGESRGVVTIVDDDWFVVETPRKLTVRWPSHPFSEGDEVVLLDINERNCAREVHGVGAKSHHGATFDPRGSFVPPAR
jgi:hypothetical protein